MSQLIIHKQTLLISWYAPSPNRNFTKYLEVFPEVLIVFDCLFPGYFYMACVFNCLFPGYFYMACVFSCLFHSLVLKKFLFPSRTIGEHGYREGEGGGDQQLKEESEEEEEKERGRVKESGYQQI